MFRLTYKDTYQVDRVLEYEDYEAHSCYHFQVV